MQTVRSWATAQAFDYRFIDDSLFDYVPSWYLQKAAQQICPISDLARLNVAKEALDQGYERTVWVDADMIVFDPDHLSVNIEQDFAFCHEVWTDLAANGEITCSHRVNNSVTIFTKNNVHLEFFIDACQRIARNKPQLGKLDVGTAFLSQLRTILPFPLLTNVGMFSPAIMADIAKDSEQYLSVYGQHITAPLASANLCGSLLGQQISGIQTDDRFYETVVKKCLETRGEVVNRFFEAKGQNIRHV